MLLFPQHVSFYALPMALCLFCVVGCDSTEPSRSGSPASSAQRSNETGTSSGVSIPTFEVVSAHPTMACLNETFTSFIEVFGVYVGGSEGAPANYVMHTAHILAQLIDNDEDGIPDDPAVQSYLARNNYIVPVWNAAARDALWSSIRGTSCEDNIGMAASMYYDEDEWALGGIEEAGTWDTNLEEVWHVVSDGWYAVYSENFGTELTDAGVVIASKLTEAMDVARGGQFVTVPSTYPEGAWYSYNDTTCDYSCQAHEYFYWILMANIDALSPSLTSKCVDSQDEWFICTKQELEAKDALAHSLLNDQNFKLPTRIPDGSYR